MNKIALFLTAALTATVFSAPVFAEESLETEAAEESAITPDGNLDVTDDLDESGRQFLTVQTRSGAEFYIIIERNRDSENVYFLNQVDDKDLFAILAANEEELVCDCEERCAIGAVNLDCELCSLDRDSCEGVEPELEVPTSETSYSVVSIVIAIALLIAVVVIFIKFRKSKPAPKPPNFDDSDDEIADEIEDEVEIETEDEE